MKSFVRLQGVNPGFDPENVLVGAITLPGTAYRSDTASIAFYTSLMERLSRHQQIVAASAVSVLPFSGNNTDQVIHLEGTPKPRPDEAPDIWVRTVTPKYYKTLRIPLRKGRLFTDDDREGTPPVAVMNETAAARLWPGANPVGKRFRSLGAEPTEPWVTVVGIVGDVRHSALNVPPTMEMYFPHAQRGDNSMTVVVRSRAQPAQLASIVRSVVKEIDPNLPIAGVGIMDDLLRESLMLPRLYMVLFGIFAGVALILAAVGIYRVIAYNVTTRTHEIGVRMALGARQADVLRLILREGGSLAAAGIVAGLAIAFAISRVMQTLLFDVSTTDPLTFIGVPVLLALVAILATLIPARRATRVEPSVALRYE